MLIQIQKGNVNLVARMRQLGYAPYENREGVLSFVKRIHGTDFPRFHLYVDRENERILYCTLHIDQVGPNYLKGRAHRGDYDTDAVQDEALRLQNNNKIEGS